MSCVWDEEVSLSGDVVGVLPTVCAVVKVKFEGLICLCLRFHAVGNFLIASAAYLTTFTCTCKCILRVVL